MANTRSHPGFTALSNANSTNSQERLCLQGIIFDMDGTLCEPQNYMFKEMRTALNIEKGVDILDHIHSLEEPQQSEAFKKVQDIEREAMKNQVPQPGLVTLMEYLDKRGIRKGICTRNFDAPVKHLLDNHLPGHIKAFSPIITRDFKPPKPSPAGILHIAHSWNVPEDSKLPVIMVGDSVDDMTAGRDAGALTVLLASTGQGQDEKLRHDDRTDVVINQLDHLIELLDRGLTVDK